jgi:hypothetical protein
MKKKKGKGKEDKMIKTSIKDYFQPQIKPETSQDTNEITHETVPKISQITDTFILKGLLWNFRSARSKIR